MYVWMRTQGQWWVVQQPILVVLLWFVQGQTGREALLLRNKPTTWVTVFRRRVGLGNAREAVRGNYTCPAGLGLVFLRVTPHPEQNRKIMSVLRHWFKILPQPGARMVPRFK